MINLFKPIFLTLSILLVGGHTLDSVCTSPNMNKLCTTEKVVDHCYSCRHNDVNTIEHCVPIFHNHLGALDNFPSKTWNCTLYRPSETTEEDNQVENDQQIIDDICEIDDFIVDMCHQQDNNGFCMIASFIHDMCEKGLEIDEDNDDENTKDVTLESFVSVKNVNYESPWGPLSECNQYFYKEICTNKVAKFCFDCRKFLGKELFTQKPRYHYYCSPFYKDMNEKEAMDWLSKEKYECKRWYNPNYKPSSFSVQNYNEFETKGKLYSACTGPICRKEGWFYRGDHFGKEWCGMGNCKEFFGNRVLCDFPTNCGKKTNNILTEHNFETLGCGSEKLKCMLKKSCRNLIKQFNDCDKDISCIYSLIIQNSSNETFQDLVKCIVPSN
jgi:hypothetical protein